MYSLLLFLPLCFLLSLLSLSLSWILKQKKRGMKEDLESWERKREKERGRKRRREEVEDWLKGKILVRSLRSIIHANFSRWIWLLKFSSSFTVYIFFSITHSLGLQEGEREKTREKSRGETSQVLFWSLAFAIFLLSKLKMHSSLSPLLSLSLSFSFFENFFTLREQMW